MKRNLSLPELLYDEPVKAKGPAQFIKVSTNGNVFKTEVPNKKRKTQPK